MKKNVLLIVSVVMLATIMVVGFVFTNTNINKVNVANLTLLETATSTAKVDSGLIEDENVVEELALEPMESIDKTGVVAIHSRNAKGEEYGYIVSHTKSPELYLANQLDHSQNEYYYAELEEIKKNDWTISLYLNTDMPIEDVYYEITDKNDNILYKGSAGLSYGHSGTRHDLEFNRQIFNDKELGAELKTEWFNEKITFYMQSGKDSSIKICPNFNIGKVAPLPKPNNNHL